MREFIANPNAAFPVIESVSPLELSVRFTQASLATLMDSVYAGEEHLVESRTKLRGRTPDSVKTERVEDKGQQRQGKFFLYKDVRPKAELISYWRGGNGEDPWVVLWRKAVRGVLRKDKMAEVYKFTPKHKSPTGGSVDLKELWPRLVAAARNPQGMGRAVPTSMFIGAQAQNAERVDFKGEVRHNLLLHFWPFVSPVFVPREVRRKRGKWVPSNSGFVLAVPEVAHLTDFGVAIEKHWRKQQISNGNGLYRPPAQSRVDAAIEGGMAFLHSLAIDKLENMNDGDFFDAVPHVELYHLEKRGNNVQMLAAKAIRPSAGVLRKFDRIVAQPRLNFMFKRLLLHNLLDGLPWHACTVETLFTRFPVEMFVRSDKSPGFAQNFGLSAREQFKIERNNMSDQVNIASKVYDFVGEFVAHRAEKRSGVKREELPKKDDGKVDWSVSSRNTIDYLAAREKVATDAFLAIRGRNSDEFVDYFVGSICAVPQFMGASGVSPDEGFIAISGALHESESKRTEMKNLTMLALCAHAWQPRTQAKESNNAPQIEGEKE